MQMHPVQQTRTRRVRWHGILEGYQNEFYRGWYQGLAIGMAIGVMMVVALVAVVRLVQ